MFRTLVLVVVLSKVVNPLALIVESEVRTLFGVSVRHLPLMKLIAFADSIPCEAVVAVTTILLPMEIYGNKIAVIAVLSFYARLSF